MKKIILMILVVSMMIITLSSAAVAFGGGNNAITYDDCVKDMLDEEDRANFAAVIEDFQEKMSALRDEIISLRENGNYAEFREKHAERFELMEDKMEALSTIVPDDVMSRFQTKGQSMRHNGWDKNSGGFKAQLKSGR